MSKEMEKELTKVITGLADAFEQEAYDDYVKNYKGTININLDKFSEWELHLYHAEQPMKQYIKEFFRNKGVTDCDKLDKIVFLYQNYSFIKMNVEKLVDLGRGCCADKSSFVVKSYIRYLSGQEKEIFYERNHEKHEYWHPDFGDVDLWYKFVDALMSLYYGYTEEYLETYAKLQSLKNETLDDIAKDNEIYRNFLPTYLETMDKNKEKFDEKVYERLIHPAYRASVVFSFFKHVKDGTVTEEIIISSAKAIAEKYA